jgi:dUTP pyrophosphatase
MKVRIKRLDRGLPLPAYQTAGSVGCDLYARLTTVIPPRSLARVPANVIIQTPPGYMFLVASRGSTPFKKGLMLANGVGIGDQDFCGPEDEYQIAVYNFTDQPVTVERGERIAQGIFVPVAVAEWVEVEAVDGPSRGGFGSTGGAAAPPSDQDGSSG